MKKLKFLLLFTLLCLLSANVYSQKMRALVIAVGNYEYFETKWRPINSLNDVPIITNALLSQGFKAEDIIVVEDPTKQQLIAAFENLVSQVKNGDVVFIHFSGHGQQIWDDNGDEVDGWDEAIIPIDAHHFFKKGVYEGENHVRDDEFGLYLEKIRTNAGSSGNVLVVVDACHSGTSTRGDAPARGTNVAFAPENYTPGENREESQHYGFYVENESMAPMACFYGAAAHQLNYEYKLNDSTFVGSLTYAFSKVFSEADKSTTYRALFDKIRVEMASIAPNQVPQAEGTLDQQILGGKILGSPDYAIVNYFYDNENLSINKGSLHGLNPGSKVGFYKQDERDFLNATPKNTGVVIFSDYTTADIVLDNPMDENLAMNSWVYITEYNYGDLSVKIKIDLKNKSLADAISNKIKDFPMIVVDNTNFDLRIEEGNEFTRGNNIAINSTMDFMLWSTPSTATMNNDLVASDIVNRLLGYTQARYLRNLEAHDESLKAEMVFVPYTYRMQGRNPVPVEEYSLQEKLDESGNIVIYEGDGIKLRITNKGSKSIFFTVLDIQPDDIINVMFPPEGRQASEYRIARGEKWESPIIRFLPPAGTETFKLIVSETPIDLRPVIFTRGDGGSRGAGSNPFQVLFAETYMPKDVATRGGEVSNVPAGSVHVQTIVFEIREK